jgi:hypothetical protein
MIQIRYSIDLLPAVACSEEHLLDQDRTVIGDQEFIPGRQLSLNA